MAFNDKSTARLNQYGELALLLNNNPDPVAMNDAFAGRKILFDGSLKTCYDYRDTANGSTKGFTKAKNTNKKTTSKSASAVTGKGNSYAITINDTDLAGKMTAWSQGALNYTNDPDFAGVIQKIYDELNPFVTSDPTGTAPYFTTPILDAVIKSKNIYVTSLGQFKSAVGIINTAKGNFVALSIPEMDTHIKFMQGFLTDIAVKYPDFVTQFKAIVQKLSIIGKRNQGMSAVMTYAADDKPINTVGEFLITNYPAIKHPKIIHTNTNGIIDLLQLKVGTWDGIFSAKGCIDQPVTVTVKAKKVTHFIISMVAITPPETTPTV